MSFPQSVKATVNFASDGSDRGSFSNTGRGVTRQKLQPVEIEFNHARAMKQPGRFPGLDLCDASAPSGEGDVPECGETLQHSAELTPNDRS